LMLLRDRFTGLLEQGHGELERGWLPLVDTALELHV
jgi:hypothetical protein